MLPPCVNIAAVAYHVTTETLETVAAHHAAGGIGPMGIQEGWIPLLEQAGFDATKVRGNACWNIIAAAWIIAASKPQGAPSPLDSPRRRLPYHSLPNEIAACITDASRSYRIPEAIYRAVLMTEGGALGTVAHNRNGTDDLGIAQINTSWLPKLGSQGITRERLLTDGCLNVHVGAWILGKELSGADPHDAGDFWRRVGNYHSHTLPLNQGYQVKVWHNLQRLSSQEGTITTLSEK